jgi:hypothetical protein
MIGPTPKMTSLGYFSWIGVSGSKLRISTKTMQYRAIGRTYAGLDHKIW